LTGQLSVQYRERRSEFSQLNTHFTGLGVKMRLFVALATPRVIIIWWMTAGPAPRLMRLDEIFAPCTMES
jgi:hypothetical protein